MKPILFSTPMVEAILEGRKTMTRRVIKGTALNWLEGGAFTPKFVADPENYLTKYNAGDILWVRETWSFWPCWDCDIDCNAHQVFFKDDQGCFVYRTQKRKVPHDDKWKPSIFMPKEAARIFLRVTEVRAERLQDITEDNAYREGCRHGDRYGGPNSTPARSARQSFMWLWKRLNAKRGYDWPLNPWVWVYTFERCEKPGGTE